MLTELNCTNKVAGAKQVKRALNDDRVLKLFVAGNADPRVTQPLAQLAVTRGIRVELNADMKVLGQACSISVGCAVAAILKV